MPSPARADSAIGPLVGGLAVADVDLTPGRSFAGAHGRLWLETQAPSTAGPVDSFL